MAAAGAGQANHAEYVSVPRNLVCRVPAGCDLKNAASATIGAIALQGVRRAAPQLGDRVCVIGLGLIGQITVQLLQAAGCRVIGLDLDAERVRRALALGLHAGTSEADAFKQMVRDLTEGHGADSTIMTAATKSNAVINLAMETHAAQGTGRHRRRRRPQRRSRGFLPQGDRSADEHVVRAGPLRSCV